MPLYKAGQEIDAYCTKCKMDLLHKIVAVADNRPAKVECRTCYTTHVFRQPKGVHAPGDLPVVSASSASSGSASMAMAGAAPRRKVMVADAPVVPPNGVRIQIYRMTERFAPETWIEHKSFGTGQVLRDVPPDKIEVRFHDGNRLLVHGRVP